MRIGIDIDDTIAYTVKSMIKYADIYDTTILGKKGINGNMGLIENRYYLKVLYGWSDETKFNFFNMYYRKVLEECSIMLDAKEIIKRLKQEGHYICFATARLVNIPNCNTEQITKHMLEKNSIPYDDLIVNASNKLKICEKKNLDIFIDDSYQTCQEIQQVGKNALLMTTKMNEKIDTKLLKRVHNWNQIYEHIAKQNTTQ